MKKAIRIWITLLIMILSVTTVAFGDIPEQSDSFYVVDEADVITEKTEEYIIEKNGELEALCGGQIVVIAVDFLDGMNIEDYAYKIFNEWGIGSSEKNNGVLLLLAIGEENYWCMQGKGLENKITSADIDHMLWNYLEDDFALANYDVGVKSFFDQMYDAVSGVYGGTTGDGLGTTDDDYFDYQDIATIMDIIYVIAAIIVILVVIYVVISIIKSGRQNKRTYTPYESGYPRKKTRPVIFVNTRPKSSLSRPARSSSRSSARPSRSSSSSRPSRSGGGGRSRGGGAGRRGR